MAPAGGHVHAMGPHPGHGFTLIEILVVLLLVGVLSSLAVIGMGGHSAREVQKQTAERLLQRMDFARHEAVMQSHSLGLRFTDRGYRFYSKRRGHWEPITDDRILARRKLRDPLVFTVELDGLEAKLDGAASSDDARDDNAEEVGFAGESREDGGDNSDNNGDNDDADTDDENTVRPQIFFLPGGEIVPGFAVRLASEDTRTVFHIEPGDKKWLVLSSEQL